MNNPKNRSIDEFADFINITRGRKDKHDVYCDFVELLAIKLSNSCDPVHFKTRQERFGEIVLQYRASELEQIDYYTKQLTEIIQHNIKKGSIEDILGYIYEQYVIRNKGEEVTPKSITRLLAKLAFSPEDQIKEKGFATLHDPFSGSGSTLLAAAEQMMKRGLNYPTQLVGLIGDKNRRYTLAAYVQVSLYGIPAIVSQTEIFSMVESDRWYTPSFILGNWVWRYRYNNKTGRDKIDEQLKMSIDPIYGMIRRMEICEKEKENMDGNAVNALIEPMGDDV